MHFWAKIQQKWYYKINKKNNHLWGGEGGGEAWVQLGFFCLKMPFNNFSSISYLLQDLTICEAIPPPPSTPIHGQEVFRPQHPGPSITPTIPDKSTNSSIAEHSYFSESIPQKVKSPKDKTQMTQKPDKNSYICQYCDKSFSVRIILKYFYPTISFLTQTHAKSEKITGQIHWPAKYYKQKQSPLTLLSNKFKLRPIQYLKMIFFLALSYIEKAYCI